MDSPLHPSKIGGDQKKIYVRNKKNATSKLGISKNICLGTALTFRQSYLFCLILTKNLSKNNSKITMMQRQNAFSTDMLSHIAIYRQLRIIKWPLLCKTIVLSISILQLSSELSCCVNLTNHSIFQTLRCCFVLSCVITSTETLKGRFLRH